MKAFDHLDFFDKNIAGTSALHCQRRSWSDSILQLQAAAEIWQTKYNPLDKLKKANDTLSLPRTMRHIAYLTFLKEKVMLTVNNDILKKYTVKGNYYIFFQNKTRINMQCWYVFVILKDLMFYKLRLNEIVGFPHTMVQLRCTLIGFTLLQLSIVIIIFYIEC